MTPLVIASLLRRSFRGTASSAQWMSPGLAARATESFAIGRPPMGKRGKALPLQIPLFLQRMPTSLASALNQLAQKEVHFRRQALRSLWVRKITTATPEERSLASLVPADFSALVICTISFWISFASGDVLSMASSCFFSSLSLEMFSLHSSMSQPITTLTISVSVLSFTACSLKNSMMLSSSVAVEGRPLTMMAKSLGDVVPASTLWSVRTWVL
mmetsp:Transcript_132139/g.313230  ORF Transcript_132139/g.313230 Transcript_132139/m.313230 type:complete len:215 (+) Transcript_132139:56-700(+)